MGRYTNPASFIFLTLKTRLIQSYIVVVVVDTSGHCDLWEPRCKESFSEILRQNRNRLLPNSGLDTPSVYQYISIAAPLSATNIRIIDK